MARYLVEWSGHKETVEASDSTEALRLVRLSFAEMRRPQVSLLANAEPGAATEPVSDPEPASELNSVPETPVEPEGDALPSDLPAMPSDDLTDEDRRKHYSSMTVLELTTLAKFRDVLPEDGEGSGANGNVLKSDIVSALMASSVG